MDYENELPSNLMMKSEYLCKLRRLGDEHLKESDENSEDYYNKQTANLYVFKDLGRNQYFSTKILRCETKTEIDEAKDFIIKGLKLSRLNQKGIANVLGWDLRKDHPQKELSNEEEISSDKEE